MTFVLLDDSLHAGGTSYLFEAPRDIIVAHGPEDMPAALRAIDAARAGGAHLAGFFAYEAGLALEPRLAALMPQRRGVPLVWLGVFAAPRELTGTDAAEWIAARARAAGGFQLSPPRPNWSPERYAEAFAQVQRYISAGDIYQANLSFRADFDFWGSPAALYGALRERQRVAYGALLHAPDFDILSLSPEQFVRVAGQSIETSPMKGTQPRGAGPEEDWARRRHLETDAKSQAENLMIVDLMRNDLARLCEPGSVAVPELFAVEPYRTVLQMVSRVEGRLRPDVTAAQVVGALLAPGSVTGAPKIRAMEVIAELEDRPRNVYCGAIGMIAPGGMVFNVAIRTITVTARHAEIGIGSGVVHDSACASEYAECLLKMRFLSDLAASFDLIETLRLEGGVYALLERHVARLAGSAATLGFRCDVGAVRAALAGLAESHAAGAWRARLVLRRDGTLTTAATPLGETRGFMSALSPHTVYSGDTLMAHKTTRRALYDGERARLAKACGADEALFCNERGEIAEGSFTNVFVARGGTLLTPPLTAGLLPGTLRAELLATGRAEEAVLWPRDIEAGFLLGNSVRGLVPAKLHAGVVPITAGS